MRTTQRAIASPDRRPFCGCAVALMALGDVKAETKLLKTCHYFGATARPWPPRRWSGRERGGRSKLMFEQDVVGRASSLAASPLTQLGEEEESKGANLNVSLSSLVSRGERKE